MTVRLSHITFDCVDAGRLAAFWAEATGRPVDPGASEEYASIGMPPTREQHAWLFLKVPEAKTAKNRMHLDVGTRDREAEVARLVGLGATEVSRFDQFGIRWTVMQDPEGNEFCVGDGK